jgi:large subunit ribosomal protein L29
VTGAELRELSSEELEQRIREDQEELLRLRFQATAGVLENPVRLRTLRREIARARTIQRERKLGLR